MLSLIIQAQGEAERRKRGLPDLHASRFGHLASYADSPVEYAAKVLGVKWWSKQIELAESVRTRRRTVVYAGHAVGKTHAIGGLAQWHFDVFQPSITLTTAPNWPSIHDLLWGEIKAQRASRPHAPGRLMDMRLEAGPMHYAKGHNAESSSGFQGRHEERLLIILDEAMGIPPFIWAATNAMMSSENCRTLATGNPTEASGEYYEIRDDPEWSVIRISCLEHPNIAAELAGEPLPFPKAVGLTWIREMLSKHATRVGPVAAAEPKSDAFEFPPGSGAWYTPDDEFRSRVLGLFPRQSANAVIGEEALEVARTNVLEWRPDDIPVVGVDVARFGSDQTILYGRRGPVVTDREAYRKQDTMETVGRVVALAERLAAEHGLEPKALLLVVDDTGLGGGVTDRLRELGYRVRAVTVGATANDPDEYHNRGSELWFTFQEIADKRRLDLTRLPADVYARVSAELRARRYKIQSDKTRRVESKEDMRQRIGRSPDDADALILAFADGQRVTTAAMAASANAREINAAPPPPGGGGGSRWGGARGSASRWRRNK